MQKDCNDWPEEGTLTLYRLERLETRQDYYRAASAVNRTRYSCPTK